MAISDETIGATKPSPPVLIGEFEAEAETERERALFLPRERLAIFL